MSTTAVGTPADQLYDRDFYAWIQQQANALRAGNLDRLDMDNLIEEIEDMGKRQKQVLRSRLTVLFMHLLKWQYQPSLQSNSWASIIKVQRIEVKDHMDDNPSLRHTLPETIAKAWRIARIQAENETGMDASMFPVECPWSFEQIMYDDFWPDAGSNP